MIHPGRWDEILAVMISSYHPGRAPPGPPLGQECGLTAAPFTLGPENALWLRRRSHYDPRMLSGCGTVHIMIINALRLWCRSHSDLETLSDCSGVHIPSQNKDAILRM